MTKTNKVTVKELKAECKVQGIKGYSKLRKAELIKLLNSNKKQKITTNSSKSNNKLKSKKNNEVSKDYKIFTYEEFNERVKLFWNLMIKYEFPEFSCIPIQHDKAKRRTNNYGKSHYKIINGKRVPEKLSFSYRMLDGRFTLEAIDGVIKHEIGHALDVLRRGYSAHDKTFYKLGQEFNFSAKGSEDIEKSSIYDSVITQDKNYNEEDIYKYRVYCPICGTEWKYKKSSRTTREPQYYICGCGHRGLKCEIIK